MEYTIPNLTKWYYDKTKETIKDKSIKYEPGKITGKIELPELDNMFWMFNVKNNPVWKNEWSRTMPYNFSITFTGKDKIQRKLYISNHDYVMVNGLCLN